VIAGVVAVVAAAAAIAAIVGRPSRPTAESGGRVTERISCSRRESIEFVSE